MGDAIVDQKGHLCEMALRKVDCLDFQESRRRNVVAWVLGLLDPPSDPPPSSPKDWGRGTEERPVSLLGREDLKKGRDWDDVPHAKTPVGLDRCELFLLCPDKRVR